MNPTSCSPPNGAIRVVATGGTSPYEFKLNNTSSQNDSLFTRLQGGDHQITVSDALGCSVSLEVDLTNFNSDLAADHVTTDDTGCLKGNGTVTFHPTGGTPPYQLKFQNITIENDLTITDLKSGIHHVAIVDAQLCEFVQAIDIQRGKTNISWVSDIKPIIDTRCAKPICHVAGTGRSDLSKLENVQQLAAQIKQRTQNGSMPFDEPMPASQIQLIACWVDDGALNN